jgi:N-acetylmuramoyl-L-alanine amidase
VLPPPKPAAPASTGERNLIRALGLKVARVVIDAGHGGHDTGSIGPSGLREKDVVLDVAMRLGKLIQEKMGSEVIYVRSDDTFVDLRQRTVTANKSNADLFISVHANASTDESIRGVETYYLNFTTNSWAMGVAARENAAADRSVHELQDLVSKIALKEQLDESREFAAKVQAALHGGLMHEVKGLRNRGVRRAPLMVLIGAQMPSVLAEIGFISNARDEKLLKSQAFRQKVAQYIYDGVASYAETLSHVSVAQKQAVTP